MDCVITLLGEQNHRANARQGCGKALIAKKVVGEVMIIERLTRYDGRPRPPSDPCQLNVPGCVYLKERFPVFFP